MIRKYIIAAFALSLCSAMSASAAESSILYNQQKALCANPQGSNPFDFVDATTCNSETSQLWAAEVVVRLTNGTAYMRLRHKVTGLCADLETVSSVDGIRVIQNICNSSATQQWSTPTYVIYSVPAGIGPSAQPNTTIVNRFSGKCLATIAADNRLIQQACGSSNYLKWFYAL